MSMLLSMAKRVVAKLEAIEETKSLRKELVEEKLQAMGIDTKKEGTSLFSKLPKIKVEMPKSNTNDGSDDGSASNTNNGGVING